MPRFFLILCALAFCAIGVATFLDPAGALQPVELQAPTVSAVNELLANYGGLQIGIGVFLLMAVRQPGWRAPALAALACLTGGLAIGRVVGLATEGLPNPFVMGLLALETLTALIALALWMRLRGSQPEV